MSIEKKGSKDETEVSKKQRGKYIVRAYDRVILGMLVEDGKKKLLLDENKNPVVSEWKQEWQKSLIFDSNIMIALESKGDNKEPQYIVQTIPTMIAERTYKITHWISDQLEKNQRHYRSNNWWARNKEIVILAVTTMLVVILITTGAKQYIAIQDAFGKDMESTARVLESVADKLVYASRQTGAIPVNGTVVPPF